MENLTITWIILPFFLGFSAYLLPRLDRYLAILVSVLSIGFSSYILITNSEFSLVLLDRFGVTLTIDSLSGYFILTNGIVSLAVILYCLSKPKTAYFYTQFIILHGSVNSVFCCADFISLYVALEVISIATFLLISYPRHHRSIWIALRYLFISNTVMLFYLIGAALVFQENGTFAFSALKTSSSEAISLILLGLLTKGGVFVSGMWLPLTHAESESPVSALLSGIVVKTGVFPIVRCAQMVDELAPIVEVFSVATTTLGVSLAICANDIKRIFAFSTISQIGYVLTGASGAGFYALTHGIAKAGLFLTTGSLSSRKLNELSRIPLFLWASLLVFSLSIMGFPLFAGFGAKALVLGQLPGWQRLWLTICSMGTMIVFSRIIFISFDPKPVLELPRTVISSAVLLICSIFLGNFIYIDAYGIDKLISTTISIGLSLVIYFSLVRNIDFNYKSSLEKIENLLGLVTIIMVLLFGILNYELP